MVELKTVIEEFRSGKINFDYKEDCCTTPGEVLILLGRLAELEEKIEKGEVLEAPCNKGDTVFWVDALNQISPLVVKEFTLGIEDERCHFYSHFGSSIHLSEEEAKHQVEINRMRACEDCYKRSVSGGFVQSCDQGRECPKIAFKKSMPRNGARKSWLGWTPRIWQYANDATRRTSATVGKRDSHKTAPLAPASTLSRRTIPSGMRKSKEETKNYG